MAQVSFTASWYRGKVRIGHCPTGLHCCRSAPSSGLAGSSKCVGHPEATAQFEVMCTQVHLTAQKCFVPADKLKYLLSLAQDRTEGPNNVTARIVACLKVLVLVGSRQHCLSTLHRLAPGRWIASLTAAPCAFIQIRSRDGTYTCRGTRQRVLYLGHHHPEWLRLMRDCLPCRPAEASWAFAIVTN